MTEQMNPDLDPRFRWLGSIAKMVDGRSRYRVRIMEFDGEWFWAVIA